LNEVNAILAYNVFPGEELSRKYAPLNALVEAGVARVWHWIKSGLAYGMLSAEKHQEEFTAKLNQSRTAKLSIELAKQRLAGISMKGHYREGTEPEPRAEWAYFVPLIADISEPEFRDFLIGLANRFDQESILYSPGGGEPAVSLRADGTVETTFNRLTSNLSPEDFKDAWSKVRRHKFVFLECAIGACTVMGRWSAHGRGLLGGVHIKDLRVLGRKHPELFKD